MGSIKIFNPLVIIAFSFFLLTSVASLALVWDIEVIDSRDDDIGYCSMALDSSGYPHVAYARDSGVFELIYKRFNGSDWETEVVDDEHCRLTSITLDSSGNPYIAYDTQVYEAGSYWYRLKCAHYNGSDWEIDIVEEIRQGNCLGNEDVCIRLDSNGYPNITFIQRWWQLMWGDYLKYGYFDGSNWHVGFILYDHEWEYDAAGRYHSFVFDSTNYFHIVFGIADITEETYGLGHKYGDNWSGWADYLSVDGWYEDCPGLWSYCSLDIDTNDCLHASYCNSPENYIGYAYYDGNDWDVTAVDTVGGAIGDYHTSIATDGNNKPHITYGTNGDLKYAYNNGTTWYLTTLDDEYYGSYPGRYNSIRVDADNLPHIVYTTYEEGTFYLKYARCLGNDPPSSFNLSQPPDGAEVPEPVTLDWEDSTDADGDTITYDVWYAADPSFDPHDEVTELTDSTYTFPEDVLTQGETYYWKVRAWDGWDETSSGPDDYWSFTVNAPPGDFNLTAPPDGSVVTEPVTLDWEDSVDPGRMLTVGAGSSRVPAYAGRSESTRSITYDVWYATDPSFDPHDEVTELTDSTYTFPEGTFSDGTTYYWKVRAWDGFDATWSGPDPYWSFTVEEEVTGISVTRFSAESARDGIELTWECADPGVGFNLYRSEEATGMRTKSRETLNAEPITGESPYVYLDSNVSDGVTYAYWLEAMDASGASETFGPATCTAGTFVPSSYALYQSRPNPARGTAVIAFDLPKDTKVTLTVYDLGGRKISTLANETLPAGAHERPVSCLAPGVYVYRLDAGEFSGVKKMVVIR
jgi:hypothetical protein